MIDLKTYHGNELLLLMIINLKEKNKENIMEKHHWNEIAPDDADEIENIWWE